MKRFGPSRRRALDASAALRTFGHHPEKTFATISVRRRNAGVAYIGLLYPEKRLLSAYPGPAPEDHERVHGLMSYGRLSSVAWRSGIADQPQHVHRRIPGHTLRARNRWRLDQVFSGIANPA